LFEKQWLESYLFLIKKSNMLKKIIFITLWILLFLWHNEIFANCEYTQEIKECYDANQSNTTREIDDFVCLAKKWNPEYYSYQIIVDKKFQEIDTKIEKYISDLEENKSYYFWSDKQENFIDGVQNINNIFLETGEFWQEYLQICSNLISEIQSCKVDSALSDVFWENATDEVEIANLLDFLPADGSTQTDCTLLAKQKLQIYKQVSYDILYLNKTAVSTDNLKEFQQKQRSSYDKILSKFMINLWYVERIWAKWPAKIKYVSWS